MHKPFEKWLLQNANVSATAALLLSINLLAYCKKTSKCKFKIYCKTTYKFI